MSARKHVVGTHSAVVALEKNARRYDGEARSGIDAMARLHADLFPETRVDPTIAGDQRFTTRETDAWCRKVAGVDAWDLDVAACDESHLASKFYEKADDGLTKPWFGGVSGHLAVRFAKALVAVREQARSIAGEMEKHAAEAPTAANLDGAREMREAADELDACLEAAEEEGFIDDNWRAGDGP